MVGLPRIDGWSGAAMHPSALLVWQRCP